MLPFEKKFTSPLLGLRTSTTVYRGKINISFIMDDPFWYAKYNIISYDGQNLIDYLSTSGNTKIPMNLQTHRHKQ